MLQAIKFLAATTVATLSVAFTDSGTSSFTTGKDSGGRVTYTTVTTGFELARIWDAGKAAPILLKKKTTIVETEGLEGSSGKLTVDARRSVKGDFDKSLYTLKEDAHGAAALADDGLLVTWQDGCCDAAGGYRAFNLRSGKLLFSYDDRSFTGRGPVAAPLVVEVPNTDVKRFVGLLTRDATRDFNPGRAGQLTKVATLTYAGLDGAVQMYDVFARIPQDHGMTVAAEWVDASGTGKNEVYENRMTLWTSDGVADARQALRGFAVKLVFASETTAEMVIPFANDGVETARVVAPAGFELRKADRR